MLSTSERTTNSINEWLKHNDTKRVFDSRIISRALPEFSVETLTAALMAMVNSGSLRIEYRLAIPGTGVLTGAFREPDEIPDVYYDRFGNSFETYTVPIVPVFISK